MATGRMAKMAKVEYERYCLRDEFALGTEVLVVLLATFVSLVTVAGLVVPVAFFEAKVSVDEEGEEEDEEFGGNSMFPSGVPPKAAFRSDQVYIKSPPKSLIVMPSC